MFASSLARCPGQNASGFGEVAAGGEGKRGEGGS